MSHSTKKFKKWCGLARWLNTSLISWVRRLETMVKKREITPNVFVWLPYTQSHMYHHHHHHLSNFFQNIFTNSLRISLRIKWILIILIPPPAPRSILTHPTPTPTSTPNFLSFLFCFIFYLTKGISWMSSGHRLLRCVWRVCFSMKSRWALHIYTRKKSLLSLLTQAKGTRSPPLLASYCPGSVHHVPYFWRRPIIFLRHLPLHRTTEVLGAKKIVPRTLNAELEVAPMPWGDSGTRDHLQANMSKETVTPVIHTQTKSQWAPEGDIKHGRLTSILIPVCVTEKAQRL